MTSVIDSNLADTLQWNNILVNYVHEYTIVYSDTVSLTYDSMNNSVTFGAHCTLIFYPKNWVDIIYNAGE